MSVSLLHHFKVAAIAILAGAVGACMGVPERIPCSTTDSGASSTTSTATNSSASNNTSTGGSTGSSAGSGATTGSSGSGANGAAGSGSTGSGSTGTGSTGTGSTGTGSTGTGSTGSGSTGTGSTGSGSTGSGSTGSGSTGSGSTGSGSTSSSASGCQPLVVNHDTSVGGFMSDEYVWYDSGCQVRSAALVQNTAQDPAGRWGGYLRQYTYQVDGTTRTCVGSSNDQPGWGYLVNHFGSTSASSRKQAGISYATLFAGANHAIHEYKWRYPIDGADVDVTVDWFFATGRDNPVWAVTFDMTSVAANQINADSRGPYGDIQWDGGANADVAGVGWGDRYKFISLNSPVDLNSGWDYSQPNTVPYVLEWATSPDAEMGSVQTQTYLQHDAGGYWFYSAWGTRNAAGPMPDDWNWTYQLDQYEMPYTLKSKRLAWGMNYGAVGQSSYKVYGDDATASGYPYQSYSVYMVLGKHSDHPVFHQVTQVETVQTTTLRTQAGQVITQGPAGVGRTDTVTYDPAGYNPIFGTWELQADANSRVDANIDVANGSLEAPILVIHDWTASTPPSQVTINGAAATAESDYFASVDATHHLLWLTIAASITGNVEVTVAP